MSFDAVMVFDDIFHNILIILSFDTFFIKKNTIVKTLKGFTVSKEPGGLSYRSQLEMF